MRQFFSVIFLIWLQTLSLILSSFGAIFNAAGSMFHVFFLTSATRHDLKYSLSDKERSFYRQTHGLEKTPDKSVLN